MTEAKKERDGKPDLSLIPYCAEVELAKAMMFGETKYGRYNYANGHKLSELVAAAKRHLGKFLDGEDKDPDSGAHHLGHVMANAVMMLHQIQLGTLRDDRYRPEKRANPIPEPEMLWQVVARSRLGKVDVVLATYLDSKMAEHMKREFFKYHWPESSFDLSLREVPNDRHTKAP